MTTRTTGRPPLPAAATLLFLGVCVMFFQGPVLTGAEVDQNRTEQIAALLSEKPAGFGLPISDRRTWKELLKNDSFRRRIQDAAELLGKPIDDQPDDLYLDFSRTGNRTRWQRVSGLRRGRVRSFALAECLENKGRFVAAFEEIVRVLCRERTWVMPAHDGQLTNFHGKIVDNDVGSFVVVLGAEPLLLDPGGEIYTARTFSSRRYDSNVLNSFGHPVPLVAGKLQRTGRQAAGRVVRSDFTDSTDTLTLDISSAYDVPQLSKLERTFVYCRSGSGSLTVTDEVVFSQPCAFGTALVTFDKWRILSSSSLMIGDQQEALHVEIAVSGAGFEIEPETLKEDLSGSRLPTRLGINLSGPVTHAVVSVTIAPDAMRPRRTGER